MRILIDQDGVLANFDLGFYRAWQHKFPELTPIPIAQRRSFYILEDYARLGWTQQAESIYTEPGFIANLPPIPGAIDALKMIEAQGHELYICTSPLRQYENCILEKFKWIDKFLGRKWTERIITTRDKTLIRADILIDDKPIIEGADHPSWTHYLFDAPYNQHINSPTRMNWSTWQERLLVHQTKID